MKDRFLLGGKKTLILTSKQPHHKGINACTSSMTDVGIQTCCDDAVSGNTQGIGFQHNSGFKGNVFLVNRKHECQNAHEADEPVQSDNMEYVILLKNVDNNGAKLYCKDCSLTESKR